MRGTIQAGARVSVKNFRTHEVPNGAAHTARRSVPRTTTGGPTAGGRRRSWPGWRTTPRSRRGSRLTRFVNNPRQERPAARARWPPSWDRGPVRSTPPRLRRGRVRTEHLGKCSFFLVNHLLGLRAYHNPGPEGRVGEPDQRSLPRGPSSPDRGRTRVGWPPDGDAELRSARVETQVNVFQGGSAPEARSNDAARAQVATVVAFSECPPNRS
jgi:hypothetical protein